MFIVLGGGGGDARRVASAEGYDAAEAREYETVRALVSANAKGEEKKSKSGKTV